MSNTYTPSNWPATGQSHAARGCAFDGDLLGDVCDGDVDGDGVNNGVDNCALVPNPGQEASDADGLGDRCFVTEEVVDREVALGGSVVINCVFGLAEHLVRSR